MTEHILICDDDATIRETLADVLARRGYRIAQAETGEAALALLARHSFDLVLLDIRLPGIDGLEVLRQLREHDDYTLVVVITAYPEVRSAVAALKAGAYDYLNKPFDLDDLTELVRRALDTQRLRAEVERLRVAAPPPQPIEGMIGTSPVFLAMAEIVRRVAAASRAPVLIRGESGTGKERVAQAIHRLSPRAAGPWVALNCSAVPEGLLESEMFGHEKGAFTDARSTKRGLLELADGGTLFLDEIGDLSLALQPKLLRAVETQNFRRVGGSREIQVDVRFVAATNRDLSAMVREGNFREDLYYRLNVAGIDTPSLRARPSDIVPMARHFLFEAARAMGLPESQLGDEVAVLLERYSWPGNVRELRNVMERALILAVGKPVAIPHLPRELTDSREPGQQGQAGERAGMTLAEVERQHIGLVLNSVGGNKTAAARQLGVTRVTLRAKLRLHGLAQFLHDPDPS